MKHYIKPDSLLPLEHCQGFEEDRCENTNAKWERNNTAYEVDRYNWSYLCPEHRRACNVHWDEMWADYYAGQL